MTAHCRGIHCQTCLFCTADHVLHANRAAPQCNIRSMQLFSRSANICIFIRPLLNTWEDAGVSDIHVRPSASSHEHLQSVFSPSSSCMTVFCSSIPDHHDHRLFFNTHTVFTHPSTPSICKGWRFDPDLIYTQGPNQSHFIHISGLCLV